MGSLKRRSAQLWIFCATGSALALVFGWQGRDAVVRLFSPRVEYRVVVARTVGMPYLPLQPNLAGHPRLHTAPRQSRLGNDETETPSRSKSESLSTWIERSAAHYEAARISDDPQEMVHALAAADSALRIRSDAPEALFNRALILDALNLRQAAAAAYRGYLTVDSSSGWATEITERSARIRPPRLANGWPLAYPRLEPAAINGRQKEVIDIVTTFTYETRAAGETYYIGRWAELSNKGDPHAAEALSTARAIGSALVAVRGESLLHDAVLAVDRCQNVHPGDACGALRQAYLNYKDAHSALRAGQPAKASALFARAVDPFREAHSPMTHVAAYWAANADYDVGQIDEAGRMLRIAAADPSESHRALHAQILWIGGRIAGIKGRFYEALASIREARRIFEQFNERENSLKTLSIEADALARMAQTSEAYKIRRQVLAIVADQGSQSLVSSAIHPAVLAELYEQHWPEAVSLLNVILATREVAPRMMADCFARRAYAEVQMGLFDAAKSDIEECRKTTRSIGDPGVTELTLDNADYVSGLIMQAADPVQASAIFTKNIKFAGQHDRGFRLPELYYQRARSAMALHNDDVAIGDFDRSLALIEQRRKDISQDQLRDSFAGMHDRIFEGYLDLLARRRLYERVFNVAEQARARLILDRLSGGEATAPLSAAAVAHNLNSGTILVEYVTLPDRLLILTIDQGGLRTRTVAARSDAITQRVQRFQRTILGGADLETARLGRDLYQLLLDPIAAEIASANLLVISPDDRLSALPFAALSDSQGRFVCENHAVVIAASSSTYTRGLEQRRATPPRRVLIVGDPAFDQNLFPQLSNIPAAAQEARQIASLYAGSQLLIAADATVPLVQDALETGDIVHLASHAAMNERDPSRSAILLAPSNGNSGLLYVYDIMKMKVKAHLIALAGCRTAANGRAHGSVRSLALAFVAAGATNVVGTLWDIDDATTREASLAFHRELQAGEPPALALQKMQIAMLRSHPAQHSFKTWAAFQVYGTGF